MHKMVDERAAEVRIRRKIQAEGLTLVKVKRGSRFYAETGPYQVASQYAVVLSNQTLADLAAKYDVLKPFERIA